MRVSLLTLLAAVALISLPLAASDNAVNYSPQDVLTKLREGNERYLAGAPAAWSADSERREILSHGQHPMACIITCADSRVSPEILFDQSLGELFVCRIAGNVVTPEITGSIEYAVDHLSVPVVIVLGHTKCGAVQAAISSPDAQGPIGSLVSHIEPAVTGCKHSGATESELMDCAINTNANNGCISLIQGSRTIQERVEQGKCVLVSATYDIASGEISWQTQLASVNVNPSKALTKVMSSQTEANHAGAAKSKSETDHTSASRSKSDQGTTKHSRRY